MFQIGDMVKKARAGNTPLDKEIVGIVVRIKEHDTGTDLYDVYFVEWLQVNQQFAYEARELALVSKVNNET